MKEKEIERLNLLKEEENKLYDNNVKYICGIDEAGRGPLAGPVVVASVIMPRTSMIEGINDSKKLGVKIALEGLKQKPEIIMVDALNNMDTLGIPYISVVKGDAKNYCIAAASIVAKVTRDRIMRQWDEVYPVYGFSKHKGYGTAEHIRILKENGPCMIHRKSFIKNFFNKV